MTGVIDIERIDNTRGSDAEKRNTSVVRDIFLALSRSDFTLLYAHMVEGGEVSVIGLDPKRLGRHASNPNFIPELFSNGMRFEIKQALVDGNRVCVEWEDRAETSTGKSYSNKGLSLFTFNDEGKITVYHEYFDPDKFYEVL